VLFDIGDTRGAFQVIETVSERDPLYPPGFANAVSGFNDFGLTDKAQALIDKYRRFDPNASVLLQVEAMQHLNLGKSADGYRLAATAVQREPTDRQMRFTYSIGLLQTLQMDRLAEEGADDFKVDALDALGRRDEAFALAQKLAGNDRVDPLFRLYNRAGRSPELIDYFEERWSSLAAFEADHPHNGYGYGLMVEVALAYSRGGNAERFNDALERVENATADLSRQGVDNVVYWFQKARYLTLAGDDDAALSALETAVNRGLRFFTPLAKAIPIFELLQEEPRFQAIEASMIASQNAERAALGMEPVDPLREFWPTM
jgi:tetratricopeptide (TPR) repeat protein